MSDVLFFGHDKAAPIPQARARSARGRGAYYPPRVKAYRDALAWTFRSFREPHCPIDGLVRVEIEIGGGNLLADLDNFVKGMLDSLVTACVLRSDNRKVVTEITVRDVEGGTGVWVWVIRVNKRARPKESQASAS